MLVGLVGSLATNSVRGQATADRPATLEAIASKMRQAVKDGKVAGAAHLMVRGGEEVYFESAGYRDVEEGSPMERDSILRFYSMSKPITSVAAMALYEGGKFKLDDPVSKFIPAFATSTVFERQDDRFVKVPPRRPISVRDVFRHTTGYAYGGNGNSDLAAIYAAEGMQYREPKGMLPPEKTIERAAEALARIPALHHPGERFTYGFSTDLLGRLIEVWSGQPLDVFLRETIFEPLKMHDTDFSVPSEKRVRLASCHTWENGKLVIVDKSTTSPFATGFDFLSGGGGLLSTIEDYSHFCQMMVQGGEYNGNRILQPDTVRLMFTDQLNGVAGPFRFGLGFAISDVQLGAGDDVRRVPQFAWGGYASTDFKLVPSERLFQIFVRQRVPSDHKLGNELIQQAYQALSPQ